MGVVKPSAVETNTDGADGVKVGEDFQEDLRRDVGERGFYGICSAVS